MKSFSKRQVDKPTNYKQERIQDLKQKALSIGIEEWKHKIMIAWFITENGALSENVLGDNGHAIGLCQCNKLYRQCVKKGDYEGQANQCLQWFKGYTQNSTEQTIYKDIRKSHNSRATWYESHIKRNEKLI